MKKHLHLILGSFKKRTMLLFLCLLSVFALFAAVNKITVVYLSDQEQEFELKKLGHLELVDGNMIIVDKAGNKLHETKISDVKRIVVPNGSLGTNVDNAETLSMVVYPNPAMDVLLVQGMELGDVLRVYTTDGVLVKSVVVDSEVAQINVSDLPLGTYLMQSSNKVVKFIKE